MKEGQHTPGGDEKLVQGGGKFVAVFEYLFQRGGSFAGEVV